jgi:dTDP-glucose 4,6-dehydratase/UDP-glucose 4-epimerase
MTKRRYLVTGGLGFLGAPIVRALVERGDEVRVLDNLSRGSREKLGPASVEVHEGDIRDPEVVARALKGMDSVFHLAFVNGTESFYTRAAYVSTWASRGC